MSNYPHCANRSYCSNLAAPWPLPYYLNPIWRDESSLEVNLPQHEYDCENVEHLIIQQDRHNALIDRMLPEYWLAGWWDAVFLPYRPHPDGGLEVFYNLKLTENITFSRPWKFDQKYKCDVAPTCWEEFMPPVPINHFYDQPFDEVDLEEDGFCKDYLLLYPWHFENDE